MSTKTELADRIDEAKDLLEKGINPGEALATELANKWSVSVRTAHRYIAHAKDIIDGEINDHEAVMEEIRSEVITEEIRNSILSSLELEAKLCSIIDGKLMAEKIVRNENGGYDRVMCLPSHRDIIYAIDKLFRKRGRYDRVIRNLEKHTVLKLMVDNMEEAVLIKKIANAK